jgi:hypothetical protein
MRRKRLIAVFTAAVALGLAFAGTPARAAGDVRLTNDRASLGGYVSNYTMVTGTPYSDDVLDACSQAGGRQNEPAVAVDPRNPDVVVGSANDYCPVLNEDGSLLGFGDIWLGYYRSENGGNSFVSSLVPGYIGDESPYAANAHVRTADSGDPVLAWDNEGRLFAGSESSGDRAGSAKTFGDVWVATYENPGGVDGDHANDGKQFVRSLDVAQGSAAPNLLGVFHDKTAIEVDRTGGACDGVVYFAWARFTGNTPNGDNSSVYVVRSTDHGATFSAPVKISQTVHDIQFPDISITGNGNVYITYREFADVRSHQPKDGIAYNKSTNCGASFGQAHRILSFEPYDPTDIAAPNAEGDMAKKKADSGDDLDAGEEAATPKAGAIALNCGDFASHCESGYTFMRGGTQIRSSADQSSSDNYIYLVYDPSIPGTEVDSGTSYGSITSEDLPDKYHKTKGSQSGIYFVRLNGATRAHTAPTLIDDPRENGGLQRFPDINADQGSLHAIWWDSRNDSCYDPARPLGNCADKSTVPALDAFAATASTSDLAWSDAARLSTETTNPNYEQFAGRTIPFGGDYLYVSSVGDFAFGVWTDWRDVVAGTDQREENEPANEGADVKQCRAQNADGSFGADTCPWEGGLDQNIYGSVTP